MAWMRLPMAAGLLVCSGCLVGCAQEGSEDCDPILDTAQFMAWVLEPQADFIWDSAGTITTLEGVEDLAPTTDAGWQEVESTAAAMEEAGALLITSSLSREGDWNEIAQGLVATAGLLKQAAVDQDADRIFDYGGRLYNTCVSCHQLYWVQGR